MYVDRSSLGATAVAQPCKRGEILTRDGCAPDTRGEYGEMRPKTVNCPPGTQYHAPTDSCRPLECPDGWFLTAAGICQQRTTPPPPPPVELAPADPTCPPGTHLENAGTRSARCVADAPAELPSVDGGSGGGGGWWPSLQPTAPAGAGPTSTTVTVEGSDAEPKGFGLIEVLVAGGLGLLVSRALRDDR